MMNRRTFLISATMLATISGTVAASADSTRIRSRRALVYRGPASSPGCPESVARLLESATDPYDVAFCGPDEDIPLTAATLASTSLYAQPGGGDLKSAWVHMEQYAEPIRNWVRTGGHYLGFCLGGYLAGATPGFGLLPGDTARYISSRGSDIDTTGNSIVEVSWRGEPRSMFFQDGPIFVLRDDATAEVLARYTNGKIAASVTHFGSGRVGVVGPHPEADRSWYTRGLINPDGIRSDLGHDLIETVSRVAPQQLWMPSP